MGKVNKQNKGFKNSVSEMKNLFSLIENYQGKGNNVDSKKKLTTSLTKIKTPKGMEKHFKDTMEFMNPNAVNSEDLKGIRDTMAIYERMGCNVNELSCEYIDNLREYIDDPEEFTDNYRNTTSMR